MRRKIITPTDFHSLNEVQTRLLEFQHHYQQIATPLEWKFTKADLQNLLDRVAAHELAPAAYLIGPREYVTEIPNPDNLGGTDGYSATSRAMAGKVIVLPATNLISGKLRR